MKLALIIIAIIIVCAVLLLLVFIQDIKEDFKEHPVGHFVRFEKYQSKWVGEVRSCTETDLYVRYTTPDKKYHWAWVSKESCKLVYFPKIK